MTTINNTNNAVSAIALQVVAVAGLDMRFAGIVNQFCLTSVKDTGWSWGDAFETALETSGDIDFAATPLGRFLASEVRGTDGWTWDVAILESIASGTAVDFAELPFGRFDGAPVQRVKALSSRAQSQDTDLDWGTELALELRAERAGRRYH